MSQQFSELAWFLKTSPEEIADGWTWPEVEGLYRQWKARPPVEVVLAGYFKFPELGVDDEVDEEVGQLSTEEAVQHFMMMGFSMGGNSAGSTAPMF